MAVKEGQTEIALKVKFVAKCHNQVLTMKPKRVQIVDGIPFTVEGEHIRFDRFEYITEDEREINFIRNHRMFGSAITEAAGI